jgi:RNA polymerase sigma-70 factor (ECF subfamily)
MPADEPFADLVRRLEAGDPEAAAAVYDRYSRRLIGLARQALAGRVRNVVDPDDVAQSVFRTFFRRAADDQFDLTGEGALWALLAEMTLRRCGRWNRHFAARKRDAAREVPLASGDDSSAPGLRDEHAPSPQDAAVLLDLLEQLYRGMGAAERQVCEMRLQGHEVAEIAARVGCSQASVFRKLQLVRERMRRLCPPEAD